MDAQQLQVPEALLDNPITQAKLCQQLASACQLPDNEGLLQTLSLAARFNRCVMPLLERQRALQSLAEQYRHYTIGRHEAPQSLYLQLCDELASGFKHLLLQVLHGRNPSHPHLTWCLYMALNFLAHTLIRHFQHYQEPPAQLWRDSHLLYWLGEQHACLDDEVAAAFRPVAANSLRALHQQMLLLTLSDPFQLANNECSQLFSALAPLAGKARLIEWDADDDRGGPLIDLRQGYACLSLAQQATADPAHTRRLELGALLITLHEPAPLRTELQQHLLERARRHWQRSEQRAHPRIAQDSPCKLAIGLQPIHAQLLEKRPACASARLLDSSTGGARLLCTDTPTNLAVGQLVLLMGDTSNLALVCWLHGNREGMHLGLRYLRGHVQAAWLRRTPSAQAHPVLLQGRPMAGQEDQQVLWIVREQFQATENLWLQRAHSHTQINLSLPAADLNSAVASRHPLTLG